MTTSPVVAAAIALALLTVFGALGFVWRAWLQHRRTGSTGFRGISGRFGSAEALALYRLNALDAGVKGAFEQGL